MDMPLSRRLTRTAVHALLMIVLLAASAAPARCEAIILFQPAASLAADGAALNSSGQRMPLEFNQNGDLLIKIGSTRITLACSPAANRFNPDERLNSPRREQAAGLNGISLTASIAF